jgi:predicted metal-binding protein/2-polyprenyl-3-methyl-5-hydroxy-6-metoxy-1,4-benzoquinol methylase
MKQLNYMNHDPQENNPQYLEDLATGYWFSETIFTAVEIDVFSLLEPEGMALEELVKITGLNASGLKRFMDALCALGLVGVNGAIYYNGPMAAKYLVKGKEDYQGDSILGRKYVFDNWRSLKDCLMEGRRVRYPSRENDLRELEERNRWYSSVMSTVARNKAQEILPFFRNLSLTGNILDVGSGTGSIAAAFLETYPDTQGTLLDLEAVLVYAREQLSDKFGERVTYVPANILESWPVESDQFDLVILSNIVHAYGEEAITLILKRAVACLKPSGYLLIHDFFFEHNRAKAALFDLNMLVNTFNGQVFSIHWIREKLQELGLAVTEMVPLASDTSLLFGAKSAEGLKELALDKKAQLAAKIEKIGFRRAIVTSTEIIHIPNWVQWHCRYGCSNFGAAHCPPNSPSPQQTREMLQDYSTCILIEGEPRTGKFQRQVLKAEKTAFFEGYYRAFALWAGPCSICAECEGGTGCKNTQNARPSMEASGIDVFETVKRAGISLRPLAPDDYYVKYFAILLLE